MLAISLNNVSKDIPLKVIERFNSSGIDVMGLVTNQIKYTSFVEESNSSYYKNYSAYYDTDNNEEVDIQTDSKLILKIRYFKNKILDFLNKASNWIDK